MKILCVSDQIDPIVYSTRMKDRFSSIDMVLSAGDLSPDYLGFITSMLNKPVYFVAGNHDTYRSKRTEKNAGSMYPDNRIEATGAVDLAFRFIHEDGLILMGLPGSILYNRSENQYSELQMTVKIMTLLPRLLWNRIFHGRAVDIILTHSPPRGIHDKEDKCHRGFNCFVWLIQTFKPLWFIHGHVHLYDLADIRVSECGPTTIVNAFSHWIIDTGEKQR